jgi:hypothetical protein
VEVLFQGLKLGIFEGGIAYTFYPGSRLIHQEAVVSTQEPNTAYLYDTGLRVSAPASGVRPGRREVVSPVTYYDTEGKLQTAMTTGPDRRPAYVRYRAIAAKLDAGSLAVFPAPHTYIAPRDYTTNMGYVWFHGWAGRSGRGELGLGVRHPVDDGAGQYYPWINAPPGTVQRLGLFYMVSDRPPEAALEDVLRFTNRDRFQPLPGYKTLTSHWHWGYTIQALDQGDAHGGQDHQAEEDSTSEPRLAPAEPAAETRRRRRPHEADHPGRSSAALRLLPRLHEPTGIARSEQARGCPCHAGERRRLLPRTDRPRQLGHTIRFDLQAEARLRTD